MWEVDPAMMSLNAEMFFVNYIMAASKEYTYEIRTADPSC
ncbi:hypothetical protein MKMG_01155 [Methanogenium sp. MK-MG]|nr:hypothetical protein MKMG_01155 [Methanogenium sp. MK-MG]